MIIRHHLGFIIGTREVGGDVLYSIHEEVNQTRMWIPSTLRATGN